MTLAFTLLDFWSLRHPEAHALRHTMLGTKCFFVSFFSFSFFDPFFWVTRISKSVNFLKLLAALCLRYVTLLL